jgi:methionyl-tRNA formyltransferase
MRIVFIGAVEFSRHCLEQTLSAGGEVVAVLTLAPEHAGLHGDYSDLRETAKRHGIPLHHIRNVNDSEVLQLMRALEPDVVFVLGWSQLLSRDLLEVAPCIGAHPALLPRNRGRHPLTWALVEGLSESGLTFLWLDEGADSGDVLWQRPFPIELEDDAQSLYAKIEELATLAIHEVVPQLTAGQAPRIPQDDAQATYWRRRTDDDRWIDWTLQSLRIYNLIRGLTHPYVGAVTRRERQDVLVWRARLPGRTLTTTEAAAGPGCVIGVDAGVDVRTGDGYLTLIDVEPPGALQVGDVLTGRP